MFTKFGADSSSRFPFMERVDRQTDTQSHRHNWSPYSRPG